MSDVREECVEWVCQTPSTLRDYSQYYTSWFVGHLRQWSETQQSQWREEHLPHQYLMMRCQRLL